jgi:small subunit ribosomal protein S5
MDNIYQDKIIQIKRVTKVIKGGKKMTFRVILVIGNFLNQIGIGIGTADDVSTAIEKAIFNGKKNIINIKINNFFSISQILLLKYKTAKILLKPALLGTGIKASNSIHAILELAGFKNIIVKQLGSNNLLNNTKATILALTLLK